MNETLIALRNVSFGYEPDRPVLREVTLEVRRGDRIALVGRNGAGKTTLLHLLVGLLRPQSGRVEAFGQICRGERDFTDVRRRVALLFQDSEDQLFCPTVLEDVAFGPLNLGRSPEEARKSAKDALEQVGLSGFEDRITHHLSVGEKRLVALATILSMAPSALLMDEPTAGLDGSAVERVIALLNGLDCALLVVSQDQDFLAKVARQRLLLASGEIRKV